MEIYKRTKTNAQKGEEEEFVSQIEILNSYVTSETEISLLFIVTVSLFLLSLKRTRFNQCLHIGCSQRATMELLSH